MKIAKREKRFLLVGGLALVANFGYAYVVEPLIDSQLEMREQIQIKQSLLDRYRPPVLGKDHYQRKLIELGTQLSAADALLLQEKKPTLAAANLQGLLHKIGQESGLTVLRENVLTSRERDSFVEIPVELSLRGDLAALRNFLYRLQTAPHLLTVPKLLLKRSYGTTNPIFTADVQVLGYVRGEEKK